MVTPLSAVSPADSFARDVRTGLGGSGQKRLPSQYLYDSVGSALFEAITRLPEYGLTRADERLIEAHAAEIASMLQPCKLIVELGSGTGRKTRTLLSLFSRPSYYPVDVSPAALQENEKKLSAVADVFPIEADYVTGLRRAISNRKSGPVLALFLGSTIGNFDRHEAAAFLRKLRNSLKPGDALLLGADLVKDTATLLLAYDDPAGITAAFNRNLLGRINRELGGDFNLRRFAHEVRYDASEQRVEMHLRSTVRQRACIAGLELPVEFLEGETIWTESSYKFTPDDLLQLAESSGWLACATWTDEEWPFAESLWTVP